jgi:zinc/manganese transport system ATP-binding protein
MNALDLRGVTLALGGRPILSRVDISIPQGIFVGVLGPNGAGKTTLLRAILGLIAPFAGQIEVLGRPATRGSPAIGYMPQQRRLAARSQLCGRDFVAGVVQGHRFGLPILGEAGRLAVDAALHLVGAKALAARPLGRLSGGERQRLLLAQALVGSPKLLLLDEPLMSLDPRHQADVVALVREVQQELGIAVLFTAHELNPLLGAMDRVLYLGAGHAACGTADAVITGPVLSRLYGAPIDVVRVQGRVFVMSGGQALEDGHCGQGHGRANK